MLDDASIRALDRAGRLNGRLNLRVLTLLDDIAAIDALVLESRRVLQGDETAAARFRAMLDVPPDPEGPIRDRLRTRGGLGHRRTGIDRHVGQLFVAIGLAAQDDEQLDRMLGGLVDSLAPLGRAHQIIDAWGHLPAGEREWTIPGFWDHIAKNDLLPVKKTLPDTIDLFLKCRVEGSMAAFAAAQKRLPYVITAIQPDDAGPGEVATVIGSNFGTTPGLVLVPQSRQHGWSPNPPPIEVSGTTWMDSAVTFKVPKGATPGELRLLVPSDPVIVCKTPFPVHLLGNSVKVHGGLIEVVSLAVGPYKYQGEPVGVSYELSPSRHAAATVSFVPAGPTKAADIKTPPQDIDGWDVQVAPLAPSGIPEPNGQPNARIKVEPKGPHGGGDPATWSLALSTRVTYVLTTGSGSGTVIAPPSTAVPAGHVRIHVRASVAFVDEQRRVANGATPSQPPIEVPWEAYAELKDGTLDIQVTKLVISPATASGLVDDLMSSPVTMTHPQDFNHDQQFTRPAKNAAWPLQIAGEIAWGGQGTPTLGAPAPSKKEVKAMRSTAGVLLSPLDSPAAPFKTEYTLTIAAKWTLATDWYWEIESFQ